MNSGGRGGGGGTYPCGKKMVCPVVEMNGTASFSCGSKAVETTVQQNSANVLWVYNRFVTTSVEHVCFVCIIINGPAEGHERP